jgi:RNA polymerase subunit RPABC4/transcription elongation factor Spt4
MGGMELSTIVMKACNVCGYISLDKKRCGRCGWATEGVEFHNISRENLDPKTHRELRWGCRACGHFGIIWQNRNKRLVKCPNCGEARSDLEKSYVDLRNSCDQSVVWPQETGSVTRPRMLLPKKKKLCPGCGGTIYFSNTPPSKCLYCGEEDI